MPLCLVQLQNDVNFNCFIIVYFFFFNTEIITKGRLRIYEPKAEILASKKKNMIEIRRVGRERRFPEIHDSAPDSTGEWAIERPNGRSELNGPEGESTRGSHVGERGLGEEGSNGVASEFSETRNY